VSLRDSQFHSTPTSMELDLQLGSEASTIGSQNSAGKTNTLILAEIIFNCFSMYKQVADAAGEFVQGEIELDDKKLSDFQLMVLLILMKIPSRRKKATVIMFELIIDDSISESLVWEFLHDLKELTAYFKAELVDLAFRWPAKY